MRWRLMATALVGGSMYGGDRFATMMWPEVSANAWLGVFLGCGLLAMFILHRKYVVALVSGKHPIAGILHYRQRRAEKIARLAASMIEEKRIRRIAEAAVLRHTEDPEMRLRIGLKLQEKWEKEEEAARRSDQERDE